MIERHWKGLCRKDKATAYRSHLINDTFKQIALIEGFKGWRILTREMPEGIEFLIITMWRSKKDLRQFAGPDICKAVVPQLVQEYMVRYSFEAIHYDVLE